MRRLAVVAACLVLTSACGAEASPGPSQPFRVADQPSTVATPSTPARTVSEPARIRIPSIGVDARLVPLGLAKDGSMETPAFGRAGWYEEGPKPGEDGPAVIAAHVDSKSGPDVFARLKTLSKGAKILVTDKQGKTHEFVAGRKQQTAKTALPVKQIWGETDGPALRLITCGGAFDKTTSHYVANIIVWADAA
ncbi:class F sortase [Nonomuraea terrae]|uniref:Class F sortase n=1 Tax=Nonomuraea terrae TaxID=2530383 RepID=A0A4R4Z8U2_9ACTN|nr:class F sortase [Nonomuraea terrae]TDD54605.1 class F sortase [Nonomuraea terrae]